MSRCTCQPPRALSVEDQSKNGVRVIVKRYEWGSYVEKSCSCLGNRNHVHSTRECPVFKASTRSL